MISGWIDMNVYKSVRDAGQPLTKLVNTRYALDRHGRLTSIKLNHF